MGCDMKSVTFVLSIVALVLGPITCAMAELDKQQIEIVSLHNQLRETHHAPKLIWDDQLASYAEHYASQCRFQHSSSPYGENLAAGYPTLSAAIHAWSNEQKQYSYFSPGFSMKTGHFTQIVWKATQKIGCGYVSCDGKNGTPGNYLVCEYSPAGNVASRRYFEKNVLPE